MHAELGLPARNWNQLIKSVASQIVYLTDVRLGVRNAWNFLHAKEWFAPHNPTPACCGNLLVSHWRKCLICFSNLPITEECGVVGSRSGVDGKHNHSGSFPIKTMNGHQVFCIVVLSQSYQ